MRRAALILAGGQGRRFGGADKAFLTLAGRPLLAHVLDRLRPQAERIAISANGDPARFAPYGLPVLPDDPAFAGRGPLAGVLAGLAWAAGMGAETLLTVPVDTPFIPETLAACLAPAPAVACHGGSQHHLVALWRCDFCPTLKTLLAGGEARVRVALAQAGARPVAFAAPGEPFFNINRPEDLAGVR